MPNPLVKKYGPLPGWAWGAIAIGFVAMVIYFRRTQGDTEAVPLTPPDEGMIRGDDGSEFTGLTGGGVGNIGSGTGSVYTDPLPSLPADIPTYYPQPYFQDPAPVYEPLAPVYEPEPVYAPEPTVVTQPKTTVTPTKQTSFQWGGRTWRKGDYLAFKAWLKKRGVTYASWAKNHPKAAMDVFGKMT